jgi:hypothetical protein
VVAAADGPELDRRHARLEERRRVRGAVAADRQRLVVERLGDRLAQRAHVGVGARDVRGGALEDLDDAHVGEVADLGEDLGRILVGEVADVDVHAAEVRDLVEGVAALDARDVDRGPVEEVGGLPAEA